LKVFINLSSHRTALIGKIPPDNDFPSVVISALTP